MTTTEYPHPAGGGITVYVRGPREERALVDAETRRLAGEYTARGWRTNFDFSDTGMFGGAVLTGRLGQVNAYPPAQREP